MEMTENLFSSTQKLLTPEFVNKFSTALNLPADKIQAGLRTIIPAFLSGMVKKGSSEVGAQSLVNIAKNQSIDPNRSPDNLNESSYLAKGDNTLRGIFGNDVSKIANSIGDQTGMNVKSVTVMMGMVAPMVMGIFNKKVRSDGLSAAGVMNYLDEQKPALKGFSLSQLMGANNTRFSSSDQSSPWSLVVLLTLCVAAFFWWFSAKQGEPLSEQQQERIEMKATEAAELSGLKNFIKSGNEKALPKRFSFENLKFAIGTNKLLPGSDSELDMIANIMKENPEVTARLEGFTDNTGNPVLNERLSEDRAQTVKSILVSKGVKSNRLETQGKGSRDPIANNNHEEGRTLNRRIDFVVTHL